MYLVNRGRKSVVSAIAWGTVPEGVYSVEYICGIVAFVANEGFGTNLQNIETYVCTRGDLQALILPM